MLNKTAFLSLMSTGDKQACYTEARRYGVIVGDSEFDIDEGGAAGAHRIITIQHHGMDCLFHLRNGDVIFFEILE
jgi:hypothetical protein